MEVKLLWQGEPLANQLVYLASDNSAHSHSHEAGADHEHAAEAAHSHDGEAEHSHDHEPEAAHSHDHEPEAAHSHDGEAEHSHDEDQTGAEEATHTHDATQLRTDAEGKVSFKLATEGTWYLQTIHLVPSEEEGLTHESNWATLTFAVGHGHSHADGEHSHTEAHEHADGMPAYVYWLASLLLVGGLFFWFNRKQ